MTIERRTDPESKKYWDKVDKIAREAKYIGQPAIPERFIQEYVDQLIAVAEKFSPGVMRDAALLRADHVMDLVKAWRDRQ